MKGKKLAALVLAGIAASTLGGMAVSAADLDEVIVNADKDKKQQEEQGTLPGGYVNTQVEVGVLGKKSTMDVPYTVTNITQKTMTVYGGPDKPQDSMFVLSPSVRQSGSILHGDFSFRGARTNGTNYYINGVPGVFTQYTTPTHILESINLISGANVGLFGTGVQYETTTPGGIVSGHSKVAPEERVLDYTQTISGRGLFGEYIDYGERFGKNKEWGLRVMTENINGLTSVKGTKIVGQSIFANIDHRSEHTKDNLLFGYRNFEIQRGLRWFLLDPASKGLPKVPNGSNDYGFDGMIKATHGWLAVYNHEQKFNDHWDGFVNIGLEKNNLDKNVMANGGSGYYLNQQGVLGHLVNNKFVPGLQEKAGATPQDYWYWQAGTVAHYNTGALKHDITISYNQAKRDRKTAYDNPYAIIGTGDLYTGIHQTAFPSGHYLTRWNNKTKIKSFGVVDSMSYKKWDFILGVHRHEAESQAFNWASSGRLSSATTTKTSATSPTYGIVYKPNDNLSIYGNHTEFFDAGLTVTGSKYANKDDVLPPLKTKSNEIGVKYMKNKLLWTLDYYDVKQDNYIDVVRNGLTYYSKSGRVRRKGVEFSVNGRIADKWSMFAGVAHVDAKQEKTKGGALDGVREIGSTEWNGFLGLQYDPNYKWSIMARAVYTGESPVFNERFYAPGYVVYDLGASLKSHIGKIPTTFTLMCYNLFDKDYWMVSRGNQVYLSTPRTLTFTAQLHF